MTPCPARIFYPLPALPPLSKYRGDALDYSIMLAPFCCGAEDSVTSLTVDIPEESGLTLLWAALSPDLAILALQGGTIGRQSLTLAFDTSTGRRFIRSMSFNVLDDDSSADDIPATMALPDGASIQPASLILPSGIPLTLPDRRILTL